MLSDVLKDRDEESWYVPWLAEQEHLPSLFKPAQPCPLGTCSGSTLCVPELQIGVSLHQELKKTKPNQTNG
jgi:hypothetical protein